MPGLSVLQTERDNPKTIRCQKLYLRLHPLERTSGKPAPTFLTNTKPAVMREGRKFQSDLNFFINFHLSIIPGPATRFGHHRAAYRWSPVFLLHNERCWPFLQMIFCLTYNMPLPKDSARYPALLLFSVHKSVWAWPSMRVHNPKLYLLWTLSMVFSRSRSGGSLRF